MAVQSRRFSKFRRGQPQSGVAVAAKVGDDVR